MQSFSRLLRLPEEGQWVKIGNLGPYHYYSSFLLCVCLMYMQPKISNLCNKIPDFWQNIYLHPFTNVKKKRIWTARNSFFHKLYSRLWRPRKIYLWSLFFNFYDRRCIKKPYWGKVSPRSWYTSAIQCMVFPIVYKHNYLI